MGHFGASVHVGVRFKAQVRHHSDRRSLGPELKTQSPEQGGGCHCLPTCWWEVRIISWVVWTRHRPPTLGLRLCERGGKNAKKRAAVTVARKLAVLLHRLWVSGEVYEPLGYASSTVMVQLAAA